MGNQQFLQFALLSSRFIIWAMNHVKTLFGIEVEIRGQENLQSDKPYILVINHQSSLDCIGKRSSYLFSLSKCPFILSQCRFFSDLGGSAWPQIEEN